MRVFYLVCLFQWLFVAWHYVYNIHTVPIVFVFCICYYSLYILQRRGHCVSSPKFSSYTNDFHFPTQLNGNILPIHTVLREASFWKLCFGIDGFLFKFALEINKELLIFSLVVSEFLKFLFQLKRFWTIVIYINFLFHSFILFII